MNSEDGINKSFTSTNKWTYIPGKVFTLAPLNIKDIKKQLLEDAQDEMEDIDSDTENVSESGDNEDTIEKHKAIDCQVKKSDLILNIQPKRNNPLKEVNIKETWRDINHGHYSWNTKEPNLSNGSRLEPVVEDPTVQVEDKAAIQEPCENKENTSLNVEPLNLSKGSRKIEDSFDLDLSALSLHTPIKKKEKPFNYVTPKINIIPPSETKSINRTGSMFKTPNVSKNPYALKKLFKTPINKPVVALQYSAKRQGTPFQSHKKSFSNYQNNIPESCEQKVSTPAVLHSGWDQFDRLTVNSTPYMIMNLLGRGGSSEVYHCFNAEDKAHVAIKVVSLSEPTTAEGYINEVKLLESLQGCDRIITMYDYEIRDEQLMVVLENGSGDLSTILKDIAKKQCHLPLYMLIYYWMEMLYAVKQIHSNGVIHSDLKPANFLRANSGLKLIDFGIASKVQEDMTCVFKTNQEGSCNYISPEALRENTNGNANSPTFGKPKYKVHFKSDVWSLGCILYQLIYRKTPFQHLNQILAKLTAITDPKHKIEYPAADWVPARMVETIKKCLQYDMKYRPSVDELIEEYEGMFRI